MVLYFILVYVCLYVQAYHCSIFLDSVLDITLRPSGFLVGQKTDMICAASVSPDVDPNTIELGWFINLADSAVTINASSYFNDSTLYAIVHFDLLTEEDEGKYTCYAIINGSFTYEFITLQNFTSK